MAQEIIVYIIIAGTITYIAFLIRKSFKRKKANRCDSCEGCPLKK
jgi:hypothetical protein